MARSILAATSHSPTRASGIAISKQKIQSKSNFPSGDSHIAPKLLVSSASIIENKIEDAFRLFFSPLPTGPSSDRFIAVHHPKHYHQAIKSSKCVWANTQ
jgi:hypothetical protein